MYYVYVLYSATYNKIYVGYTHDLADRLKSHNELATKGYTIRYRPWVIAFQEEFNTKVDALRREKALKSSRGRVYIWNKLKELGLISVS